MLTCRRVLPCHAEGGLIFASQSEVRKSEVRKWSMLSKVLNRDRRSFFLSLCLSVFLSPVFLTRNGLNLYLFNDNERHTTKKERKKERKKEKREVQCSKVQRASSSRLSQDSHYSLRKWLLIFFCV